MNIYLDNELFLFIYQFGTRFKAFSLYNLQITFYEVTQFTEFSIWTAVFLEINFLFSFL